MGTCYTEGLSAASSTQNQLNILTYDAAGNVTNDGLGNTPTYDDEDRIATDAGYTYSYDADGMRMEKAAGSTGTMYWPGPGGEVLTETDLTGTVINEEYVYFNGERIARVDHPSGAVHYYFSNHLGSANVVTDARGNIQEQTDYYPFGGIAYASGSDPNHYKFTGKERDSESNLDNFGARYFASTTGRFMTPDWAARPTAVPYAVFGDPQSLNLYIYVRNDPVTRADADGHGGVSMGDSSSVHCGPGIVPCVNVNTPSNQAQNTQTDPTAPPPPPTPDPAGTRTDPKLNPQPNDSSTTSSSSSTRTPAKGPPDTTVDVGGGTDRKYGPDGRAVKDVDSGHDHGAGDPHAHDWDWSGAKPQRGPGRPLTPEEQKQIDAAKKALIIYFIVSEGSRILFPPRNLVPVP